METKKIILPVFVLAIILGLAGLVSGATCSITTPGTSETINGASYVVNVSVTGANAESYDNCSVTASSTLSGGSWTVGTALNDTEGSNSSNVTVSTLAQNDAADWAFSATCTNGTTLTCTGTTSVTIDNTVPSIGTYLIDGATAANGTIDESTFTFSATVYNATSCNSYWQDSTADTMNTDTSDTSCTFTGSSSYSSSGTSATCTLSQAGASADTIYIDCTDGTNTTTGTQYAVYTEGYVDGGDGGTSDDDSIIAIDWSWTEKFQDKKILVFVLLLATAFVLVALAFMSGKKK